MLVTTRALKIMLFNLTYSPKETITSLNDQQKFYVLQKTLSENIS